MSNGKPAARSKKPTPLSLLAAEFAKLVQIDEQRTSHAAALDTLQGERATQIGRMQILAEQAGVSLEAFVGEQIAKRQA